MNNIHLNITLDPLLSAVGCKLVVHDVLADVDGCLQLLGRPTEELSTEYGWPFSSSSCRAS